MNRVRCRISTERTRRTSTTLPDTSVAHTSYWLTGQEKASYGSQTNRQGQSQITDI
jgi:hypothetical protein